MKCSPLKQVHFSLIFKLFLNILHSSILILIHHQFQNANIDFNELKMIKKKNRLRFTADSECFLLTLNTFFIYFWLKLIVIILLAEVSFEEKVQLYVFRHHVWDFKQRSAQKFDLCYSLKQIWSEHVSKNVCLCHQALISLLCVFINWNLLKLLSERVVLEEYVLKFENKLLIIIDEKSAKKVHLDTV